jgi:hypothetical protein
MGDYMKEWEAYKSLKRKFLLIWLSYLPVCFVTFLISALIFGKGSSASILIPAVVGLIWVGLFLSLAARLRGWKCPRCHAAFHSWWRGVFTPRCANCGLEKYS